MIGRIGGSGSERGDLDQMGILTIGVPDVEHAQELVTALEDRWACCATERPEQPMTIVFLSPHNVCDFAQLVRRVQRWLSDRSLGPITLELRGSGHIHGQPAS